MAFFFFFDTLIDLWFLTLPDVSLSLLILSCCFLSYFWAVDFAEVLCRNWCSLLWRSCALRNLSFLLFGCVLEHISFFSADSSFLSSLLDLNFRTLICQFCYVYLDLCNNKKLSRFILVQSLGLPVESSRFWVLFLC